MKCRPAKEEMKITDKCLCDKWWWISAMMFKHIFSPNLVF